MIRISITGILGSMGGTLLMAGLVAAAPAPSWEPVCRATNTFMEPCLVQLVELELASSSPRVSNDTLMGWCGGDQLCRLSVLNGRPADDVHAELALCEVWVPDLKLTCEQGVRARQGAR